MDTARALAQAFRRCEVGAPEASPLRERVAVALSRSDDALRALEAAPARGRRPPAVLAALHDLALSGRAPALPVVVTTWTLSASTAAGRRAFLRRLHDVAADRPVAWASVEGVGVAPSVPTLGDRPASGHSTVGVAVLDGASSRVEAVGRCWGRGR